MAVKIPGPEKKNICQENKRQKFVCKEICIETKQNKRRPSQLCQTYKKSCRSRQFVCNNWLPHRWLWFHTPTETPFWKPIAKPRPRGPYPTQPTPHHTNDTPNPPTPLKSRLQSGGNFWGVNETTKNCYHGKLIYKSGCVKLKLNVLLRNYLPSKVPLSRSLPHSFWELQEATYPVRYPDEYQIDMGCSICPITPLVSPISVA